MKPKSLSIVTGVLALAALLLMSASGTVAQGLKPPSRDVQGPGAAARPSSPAAVGNKLAYQGRLTASNGSPVNSQVQMVFTIYDASDTALWTSATRTITPTNGLFTVHLGADPDPSLGNDVLASAASIGVTVGSDAEMTPRQPLNTLVGHSVNYTGVAGNSSTGTGVDGTSTSGIGVYGWSNSSYGVNGRSESGLGVFASGGGSGRYYPALRADNTLTTTGMAGYFTNNSDYATAQFGNAGDGQVLYLQNAYTGTTATNGGPAGGAFIQAVNGPENATLFTVSENGDVTQELNANGLVKAGVDVFCAGQPFIPVVSRSFPQVSSYSGTSTGTCLLRFPFDVNNRYWVASALIGGYVVSCTSTATHTDLNCSVYNVATGAAVDGMIMVLVY